MTWVIIIGTVWLVLAVVGAVLIGRTVRVAEHEERPPPDTAFLPHESMYVPLDPPREAGTERRPQRGAPQASPVGSDRQGAPARPRHRRPVVRNRVTPADPPRARRSDPA